MIALFNTPIIRTFVAILLTTSSSILVSAACYYPDGSIAQDIPCTDSTSESTCCGTGYACFGHESSFFLCQATGEEFQKPGASQFVRGSCTDQSWRSGNCPNVCIDPDRDNTSGGHGVASCPRSDILFYCISEGLGVEDCSTGHNLIDFVASPSLLTTIGVIPPKTSSSSPSSTTTSSSTSRTPDPAETTATTKDTTSPPETTTTTPPSTEPSSSNNNGTTIGIAVGVSIGVLGLLVGGIFAFLYMRKKKRLEGIAATGQVTSPATTMATAVDPNHASLGPAPMYIDSYKHNSEPHASYVYIPAPSEAPANEHVARYELAGNISSTELDSQGRRG